MLKHKKEKAILALLTERTIEEAARVAGVGARTLHRWRLEPEFNAAYLTAKRTVHSQATGRLQQMAPAAVTTLGKMMVDPSTPAATKIRAAESILHHARKALELEDFDVRLAAIEGIVKGSAKST